jgi:hypothetical protein
MMRSTPRKVPIAGFAQSLAMMNNFESGALARPISDQQPVESARMVIRILFVSWAVFLLASQLVCGCATFLHWLSSG